MGQFNLNLRQAKIYQAVRLSNWPIFSKVGLFKKIFLTAFVLLFLFFLFGFLTESLYFTSLSFLLGLSMIAGAAGIMFWEIEIFFQTRFEKMSFEYQKKSREKNILEDVISFPEKYNLADFLSLEVARSLNECAKSAKTKNLTAIDTASFLYFLLKDNKDLHFIFDRTLLDIKAVSKIFKKHINTLETGEFTG